jgi:hypothetical protein
MKIAVGNNFARVFTSSGARVVYFNQGQSIDWWSSENFSSSHALVDSNANTDKTYGLSGQSVGLGPIEFNDLPEKAIGRFLFAKDQPINAGSPFVVSIFAASLGGIASVELSFDYGAPVTMTAPGAGSNNTNEYRYEYTPDAGATHASRVNVRAKITPLDSNAVPRLIEESVIIVNGAYEQRFVDSLTGSDTNDGQSIGNAYKTLGKAVQDVRSGKGLGKLDQTDELWEIVLVGGEYDWNIPAIGGHTVATQHTWLTIRSNDPGSKAIIRPADFSVSRCNLRVQLTRWKDIYFDFTSYADLTQNKTSGGFKGDNLAVSGQFTPYRVWLDGCTIDGPDNLLTNGSSNTEQTSSFNEISPTPGDWSDGWTLDIESVLSSVIDSDFNSAGTYTGDGQNSLSGKGVLLKYEPGVSGGTVTIECTSSDDRDLIYNNPLSTRLIIPSDQSSSVDTSEQYFPFRLGDLMTPSGEFDLVRTNVDGRYSWLADIPTTSESTITFEHRYLYNLECLKSVLFNSECYATECEANYFGDGILSAELCKDVDFTLIEGDVISYNKCVYNCTMRQCGLYGDGAHRDQYQSGDNNITASSVLGSIDETVCVKENIVVADVDYKESVGQGIFVAGRANRTYGMVFANNNWSISDFTFPLKAQIDNDRYIQHNHLLILHNTSQQQLTWKIESSFVYGTDSGGDPWFDSSGNAVETAAPRYSNCAMHGNLLYDFIGPTPRGNTMGDGLSDGCLQDVTNDKGHQNFYFFTDQNSFSNFYPLNIDAQVPADFATYNADPSSFPLIVDASGLTNATLASSCSGTLSAAPYFRYDINGSDRLSSGTYDPGSGDVLPMSTISDS